jgi:CheY-like chemotaxis protein
MIKSDAAERRESVKQEREERKHQEGTEEPPRSSEVPSAALIDETMELIGPHPDDSDPSDSIGPKLSILVVDDSAMVRKFLIRILSADGHKCEEAENGQEAVDRVVQTMTHQVSPLFRHDAILMDFTMPIKDGPTATREIRALGYSGPIIGVTGNALLADKKHFLQMGADDVYLKPVNSARLREVLSSVR